MGIASEGSELIRCPICTSPLVQGKAPFYIRGEYVGDFESIICKNSHFSALTESGYIEATRIAEQHGLIGRVEDKGVENAQSLQMLKAFTYKPHSVIWGNFAMTRLLAHQALS